MAKKHAKLLNLEDKLCRLGKISNNLEKHGNEYVTAFTIPVSGLLLTADELNEFMGDKHCHSSWYDKRGQLESPMPWWRGESFAIGDAYEAEGLTITVSGDRELEFEGEEPKGEEDDGRAACEITRIVLEPQQGGLTEMRFSLSLRPERGRTNTLLQEHQHREVKLTLEDAHAKDVKSTQDQLPLGGPAAEPATAH